MSDEPKSCSLTPNAEPTAERSHLPIWIIVVTLLLLFVGGTYFDRHSGWFDSKVYAPFDTAAMLESYQPQSGISPGLAQGKRTYESVCGICHGPDGLGKPGQAPPLAGSEWVMTKGVTRLIHIPLTGVNGAIKVEGKDWNMSMAAMGAALSDTDLANVLTYIRGAWGNGMGEVTADDVKAERNAVGTHPQPMSGDALMKMPE